MPAPRTTLEDLDPATATAIITGSVLIQDDNGKEFVAPISALGGARLLVRTTQAADFEVRLTSPGQVIEDMSIAASVDGASAVTATTDPQGTTRFSFPNITRGVMHRLAVSAAKFLRWEQDWFVALLSEVGSTLPSVTGTGKVGDTLTVDAKTWTNNPTEFFYRYLRGTYVIPGANGPTYTPVAADAGNVISAQVAAGNAGGISPWVNAGNTIGPITNKTSVLQRAPTIAGDTAPGSRITMTDGGAASNNAISIKDEWLVDGAPVSTKHAATRLYINGSLPPVPPFSYGDNTTNALATTSYTGTNIIVGSIAAGATENDYIYYKVDDRIGNDGPQDFAVAIKHLSTNGAVRVRYYLARLNANAEVLQEVQMPRFGAASGAEFNFFGISQAVADMRLTHDFGAWQTGDYVRIRQEATNSGSGSNNFQWDHRNGASYFDMPVGPLQGLQTRLSSFTTRRDMAGKSVKLRRTFSNRFNEVVAESNALVLGAAATQTSAPTVAGGVNPRIVTSTARRNSPFLIDLGSYTGQPTDYAISWEVDGVPVANATSVVYTASASDDGKALVGVVKATNEVGAPSFRTDPVTIQPPAVYFNAAEGNNTNTGLSPDQAKQTSTDTNVVPTKGAALLARGVATNASLGVKAGVTYADYGDAADLPTVGNTSIQFPIDCYTDGLQNKSDVVLRNLKILSAQRGVQWRQGSRWVLDGLWFADVGFNAPSGQTENTQGVFAYNGEDLVIRNCFFDLVRNDAVYTDAFNFVLIEDSRFLPVAGAEGDSIQTRHDRGSPRQKGCIIRRSFLDMHSRKTASGKGCIVTNMHDNVAVTDNIMDGNNFVRASDEGADHVFARNVLRYARLNSYSQGFGIGGYDNQPASERHWGYDNSYFDMNRAISFTGIGVRDYTGPKSGRVDMRFMDETVVKCAVGIRADRPTSGLFRGFVFHNVTTPVNRTEPALPPGGEIQAWISEGHYVYNGVISKPPTVTTRSVVSGTRAVGQTLTATATVFDTAEVLAAFPDATITRSYQWRRHRMMPRLTAWKDSDGAMRSLGWTCEWIDGATAATYTVQAADQGYRVSRVERIHLTFTEGGVSKTVTALAYDGSYTSVSEVTRTGDLLTAMPTLLTTGTVSVSAAEDTVIVDQPPLITGETRELLRYTGTMAKIDANGDIVKGPGTTGSGTQTLWVRSRRGPDTLDWRVVITLQA